MTKTIRNNALFQRRKTAESIIDTISKSIKGSRVSLRGSISKGTDDDLSDIDIMIKHDELSDLELGNSVVATIKSNYPVVLEDWAGAFLPEECVITFFIKDFPLHCFVEVSISANESRRVLTRDLIVNKSPDHELKLWVIASKKLSRKKENFELKHLSRSLLGKEVEQIGGPIEALKRTIKSIPVDINSIYSMLHTKCINYINSIEQVH